MGFRRNQSLNITLCGFYGCGKTSVGFELARRMRRQFVDVPQELVRRSRNVFISMPRWGRQSSPDEAEPRLVTSLMDRRDLVVALSAESLDDSAAMAEVLEFSYLVFLDPPFDVLYPRLQTMPAHREQAARLGHARLLDELAARRGLYERCDLQLIREETPVQLAALILHCFCT